MVVVYKIRACRVHGTVLNGAATCAEPYQDKKHNTIYCDNGEPVDAISVADHERIVARLTKALRDVKFHTGLGEAKDGTIGEIRETVDDALEFHQFDEIKEEQRSDAS